MKKTLIAYYTGKGSNEYLAHRFAKTLDADLEEIHPRINGTVFLITIGLLGIGPGIHPLKKNPADYENVLLVGPIWTGQLIPPLRDFLRKYKKDLKRLFFATNCGGGDKERSSQFGYDGVFEKVRRIVGDKLLLAQAFPIPLVVPEEKWDDGETMMNTRLSDENFKGEILERFDRYVEDFRSL